MLISLIIAFAFPSLFPTPQIPVKRTRVAGWVVERRTDRFTGWSQCSARNGGVQLAGGAVVFDFGRSVNTGQAAYRIDDGEARMAQQSAFARSYWTRHEADAPLDNPSGGRLALPARNLVQARTIAIRVNTERRPQIFKLDYLGAVLSAESALGCPAEPALGGAD